MPVEAITIDGIPSYLDLGSALAIAANFPANQIPAFLAANPGQQSAAVALASLDVDSAGPYQGRRFNPNNQDFQGTPGQHLEFPRVAYESRPRGKGDAVLNENLSLTVAPLGTDVVWDWDATNRVALIPWRVKHAVIYQADSILAGTRKDRIDAIYDGLVSQSTGAAAEAYRAALERGPAALCRLAYQMIRLYRLKGGRIL
jgi:hypothetical protein